MERAENGQIHAAEVEPEPTLIPEDIDLKRTDDCLFSSSGKVIEIAGFVTDSIMVFKLSYLHDADKLIVTIEGKLMVNHPLLRLPHGIDFVDEHTLAAVNREGCLWCTIGGTIRPIGNATSSREDRSKSWTIQHFWREDTTHKRAGRRGWASINPAISLRGPANRRAFLLMICH